MVAERLHCRDYEQASLSTQVWHQSAALQEVFDLRGTIKGHLREFLVHRANDAQGMPRPVQKIRVAKRDVGRACLHLTSNVLQDDGFRDEKKASVIDRHDWAMETVMEASTAGLGVSDQSLHTMLFEPGILIILLNQLF